MLNRRSFLVAATVGVGAAALGGCARGSGGSGGSGFGQVDIKVPSEYDDRDIKLALWSPWSESNGKVVDDLVGKFNESQQDIYVQASFQGSYSESAPKFTAALQARKTPDLMVLADTYWGRFMLNDTLEPLSGYFGDGFDKSAYVDALIDEGDVNGEIYWISFARSTPLFYYNRTLFDDIGLPDRGPETWTELREWGAEIMKVTKNGKPVEVHAFTGADDWQFQAATWEFGGRFSDGLDVKIGNGGAVDAAEWQRKFIHEDKMARLVESPSINFGNGLCATCMDSTGILKSVYEMAKFDVGASPLPAEKMRGVPTGGSGFVIPKGAPKERKEAAFEVIKFLGQPENSAAWTLGTGYLPVIKAAVDEPALAKQMKDDPNFKVAITQLPEARKTDAIRAYVPNATEEIVQGIQKIFGGNESGEDVLADVASRLSEGAEEIQEKYDKYYG